MTPGSSSPLQGTRHPAGCTSATTLCKVLFILLSLFAAFAGFRDVLRGDIIIFSTNDGRPSTFLQGNGRDDNDAQSASDRDNYDHYQPTEIFSENDETTSSSYFVFLQKFPLESTFRMIFHTEVVVCPRDAFSDDPSFLRTLDDLASSLSPPDDSMSNHPNRFRRPHQQQQQQQQQRGKHYAQVPPSQWSTQSNPRCTQLGYGGSSCSTPCCSVPHHGTNYPLNSQNAVIGNAMGEYKELYLYGVSDVDHGGLSGEDAYRAVCRRVTVGDGDEEDEEDEEDDDKEDDTLPTCVSNWAGTDYNPLTNNCNTFTSTVLKCVFGLSDDKPDLGVSDLITVECPEERRSDRESGRGSGDGGELVNRCIVPEKKAKRIEFRDRSGLGESPWLDLER